MFSNPFVVTPEERSRLVDELLGTVHLDERRYSVHIASSLDATSALGLSVVEQVFGESFGNGPELLLEEYSDYLLSMLHIIVCDAERRIPVGSIGLIRSSPAQLKTIVDMAKDPWNFSIEESLRCLNLDPDAQTCWDIATMAVLPAYRKTKVVFALLHAMVAVSQAASVENWTTILDDNVLPSINAMTGNLFSSIGGRPSGPYLGSESSTAAFGRVPERGEPLPVRSLTTGVGLDESFAFSPELIELRLGLGIRIGSTRKPTRF